MKKKIIEYVKRICEIIKRKFHNLTYWFPVIIKDNNVDWMCMFILLRHKLVDMRRELYPNGENPALDQCLQKMYAITELRCENVEQMNQLVSDALSIIQNNYSRWYK